MSCLPRFRMMVFVVALLVATFGAVSPAFAQVPGNTQSVDVMNSAISSLFKSRITVRNRSESTIYVKVSKACGTGQDGYWRIPPGQSESWSRCIYASVKITVSRLPSNSGVIYWTNHSVKASTVCNYFVYDLRELTQPGSPPKCL